MLWTIIVILLVLWLVGWQLFHIALIHLLLVIALIVLIVNLIQSHHTP